MTAPWAGCLWGRPLTGTSERVASLLPSGWRGCFVGLWVHGVQGDALCVCLLLDGGGGWWGFGGTGRGLGAGMLIGLSWLVHRVAWAAAPAGAGTDCGRRTYQARPVGTGFLEVNCVSEKWGVLGWEAFQVQSPTGSSWRAPVAVWLCAGAAMPSLSANGVEKN